MSDSNSISKDTSISDRESTGSTFHPGTVWEGSMFPTGARDPHAWGPQSPLEFIPPAGPFDEEESEESWRVSNGGRDIYTGEVHVRSRAPTAQQQERRNQFWQQRDTRETQEASGSEHQVHDPARPAQFPDALPTPSARSPVWINTSQPSAQPSPDVDGEYEVDDEHLPDISHGQPHSIITEDKEQLPDSTPPPRSTDDWNDDNLLSFWKFKVIRKKGYEPMLAHFPSQTTDTLHETWKNHRKRCEELGAAWRAAGKPDGPVADWFEE